jgi:hypothetical protein
MSWIQENKFTAALAGVTLVGSVALLVLANGKGSDFEDAQKQLKRVLKEEKSLQEGVPYPNPDNADALKQNVNDFAKATNTLQRDFMAYKPKAEDVEDFAPDQFSKKVSGYRKRLDKVFRDNGVQLPEGCLYGFEAYLRTFPRPVATGELNYQMKALEWLFTDLAQQRPEALINVVRPAIEIETKKSRQERGRQRKGVVDEKIYDSYPIELSFRCSEDELKRFLENVASSKDYYFAVNAMRIQNERQTPPNSSDAKFPVVEEPKQEFGGFDSFEGFGAESSEAAESGEETVAQDPVEKASQVASDADQTRLLMQILGDEKVNVFLKLDLIVLKQNSRLVLEERKKAQLSEEVDEEA